MKIMTRSLAVLALVAASGCSQQSDPIGNLELEASDVGVAGTYTAQGGEVVTFESATVASGVVELTMDVNGMTLVATIDETGAADIDGFAHDGQDTQMTEPDRAVLQAFANAVFDEIGRDEWAPARFLVRFSSLWASYPDTVDLQRLVLAQENRSYSSLCAYKNNWWYSTHDGPGSWLGGCGKDNWDDKSSYYGYLSSHGAGPCSDGTYFWNGSSWVCYEPDHSSSVEYAYGNCFGQCGSGCGSPDYTVDCANHDSCVRFGHSLAAISCDDEFTFTIDDAGFSPNCY